MPQAPSSLDRSVLALTPGGEFMCGWAPGIRLCTDGWVQRSAHELLGLGTRCRHSRHGFGGGVFMDEAYYGLGMLSTVGWMHTYIGGCIYGIG